MPGQIIVYCDTVAKTVRLAKLLDCVCYHRQVGSRGEKAELVRQLTEGRQQVFTATNALGLGVDAPTIRVVIHVGTVRKLRDYAQESGRAGRDGQKSEAIIVRGERYRRDGSMQEGSWGGVDEEMREFITTKGCMRVVLDREMDGRMDRVGCEVDEERCSGCFGCQIGREAECAREDEDWREDEGDAQEAGGIGDEEERVAFDQEGRARRLAAQREMELQTEGLVGIQGLEEMLDEWKEGCQRCRAWGEGCEGHGIANCTATEAAEIRKGVAIIASSIQWERFSCCFECGIPQAICERYEGRADGGWKRKVGGSCQYRGVLIASIASIWARWSDSFTEWAQERMVEEGVRWQEDDGEAFKRVVKWLGKKTRWGGIESNKMCWAFWAFAAYCREIEE